MANGHTTVHNGVRGTLEQMAWLCRQADVESEDVGVLVAKGIISTA